MEFVKAKESLATFLISFILSLKNMKAIRSRTWSAWRKKNVTNTRIDLPELFGRKIFQS